MTITDKEGKNMILVSVQVFEDDAQIAIDRPALAAAILLVKAQITKIIEAQTKQGTSTEGETTDKKKKFNFLCNALFRICSAASGYASFIENDILKAKVNFTLAQIKGKQYNGIGAFADGIILVITPIIGSLATYGATNTQLTKAVDTLAAYRLAETETTTARDERAVQTAAIHPFVVEGKRLLTEHCDPIAATLFEDNPEWYALWVAGRTIQHFPHGTTVAEGFVLDANSVGIYKANVFFPEQSINVKTLLDGSYTVPHFPHGVTTPVATAPLYQPNTAAPYEIKLGKTVHHDFNMTLI